MLLNTVVLPVIWDAMKLMWRYCEYVGNAIVHYSGVMMSVMASQITGVSIVSSVVCTGADQSKHQSSASLAFVREFTVDRWIPRTKGQ